MRLIGAKLLQFVQTLYSATLPLASAKREQMAETFSAIYEQNAWGNSESISGPGSTATRAADFIDELVALLKSFDTRVLLDAPCGDFNWAGAVADAVEHYIGLDVVPELIASHQQLNTNPGRSFICADLACDTLPKADVILCRDCLVHFSFQDIELALSNFKRSGSRYLLTTSFIDWETNTDIPTGGWRPINLQAAPFLFHPPLAMVDEKCTHSGGIYRGKRLAIWELASLPEIK